MVAFSNSLVCWKDLWNACRDDMYIYIIDQILYSPSPRDLEFLGVCLRGWKWSMHGKYYQSIINSKEQFINFICWISYPICGGVLNPQAITYRSQIDIWKLCSLGVVDLHKEIHLNISQTNWKWKVESNKQRVNGMESYSF